MFVYSAATDVPKLNTNTKTNELLRKQPILLLVVEQKVLRKE
jgi:hypothetical protein